MVFIFQDLVNIEMFLTAKEVEESLERQETATCLAWCHDNKSRLRKMKVRMSCDIQISEPLIAFHVTLSCWEWYRENDSSKVNRCSDLRCTGRPLHCIDSQKYFLVSAVGGWHFLSTQCQSGLFICLFSFLGKDKFPLALTFLSWGTKASKKILLLVKL